MIIPTLESVYKLKFADTMHRAKSRQKHNLSKFNIFRVTDVTARGLMSHLLSPNGDFSFTFSARRMESGCALSVIRTHTQIGLRCQELTYTHQGPQEFKVLGCPMGVKG